MTRQESEQCGKMGHDTAGEARRHLSALKSKHGYQDGEVYRCEHCGRWHVGRRLHSSKRRPRRIGR